MLIGLASCSSTPTINPDKPLPIEVVQLKEANLYDTVLTINTNKQTFMFKPNEKGETKYIGCMDNKDDSDSLALGVFIVGILLGLLGALIITLVV